MNLANIRRKMQKSLEEQFFFLEIKKIVKKISISQNEFVKYVDLQKVKCFNITYITKICFIIKIKDLYNIFLYIINIYYIITKYVKNAVYKTLFYYIIYRQYLKIKNILYNIFLQYL